MAAGLHAPEKRIDDNDMQRKLRMNVKAEFT